MFDWSEDTRNGFLGNAQLFISWKKPDGSVVHYSTLPFLWGAVTQFVQIPLSANLLGAQLQVPYGIVIFAYMSGTHWNFAARYQQGESPAAYIFAVMPALLLFVVMVFVPQHLHLALMIGFPMLLLADGYFAHAGVTPSWWMNLRLWLSSIVTLTLLITYIAA